MRFPDYHKMQGTERTGYCERIKDPSIGKRAYQEVLRLFPTMNDAFEALECSNYPLYNWAKGAAQSAVYLAKLLEFGADIHWILTGKRTPVPFTDKG